jgi:hypothetical protein
MTLPEVPAPLPSFAPADDVAAQATRRSANRVSPIQAYNEGAEGRTVLRAAEISPIDTSPAPVASPSSRRGLAIGLAVAVLAVIVGVALVLLNSPSPDRPSAAVTVSEAPPDVGQPAPSPGPPQITCSRSPSAVSCEWSYTNQLANDQFVWRVKGTNNPNQTTVAKAQVQTTDKVCIEVKVFRHDGTNAPAAWTEKCA